MSIELVNRAKDLLSKYRRHPGMYASTRESWLCIVCTVLQFIEADFVTYKFYAKHLGTYGNSYLTLDERLTDIWAQQVADDALNIISNSFVF